MPGFDVVLVAVDNYPDPPGRLAASDSATQFGDLLGGGRGGRVGAPVVAKSEQEFLDAIRDWERDATLTASVVYLVGHGQGNGLDHEFLIPDRRLGVVPYRTEQLAAALQRDWQRRQRDPVSWTLLVLDCCDSALGVANIIAALAARYPTKPKRLGLWPVAPGGGVRTGVFVAAFERALGTFTENDTVIRLDEVFRRMRRDLGDLDPEGFLPDEACLSPATPAAQVVMPLDVHAELHRAIDGQPPHVRSHFLTKAQGGEVGEVVWHFTGREREVAALCDWLAGDGAMKVVTGEAGSGKSALLGHLVLLANPVLVSLYAQSGIAPHLADGPRPPDNVFRAVVHLTGKTATEAIGDIGSQLWTRPTHDETGTIPDHAELFAGDEPRFEAIAQILGERDAPVLVDALDESQEPERIAAFLHNMAERGVLRVLVGTRRSTGEGPDQPADRARRNLLDALGADDADLLVVERDQDAVRDYTTRRLLREGSAYRGQPARAEAVAARIAEVDQPFLFARLATEVLFAYRALSGDELWLSDLLGGGHRKLFAVALERIAFADPPTYDLVRALAYARGRGLPRSGGIWVDTARAVAGGDAAAEETVAKIARIAGPYVTLDGEAGQSTYRLAHQTFVEFFRSQDDYSDGHRRIAAALAERERGGGWANANYYAVRYLPEHLVADADRLPPDAAGLAALVTDAGWLVRAIEVLGVDRTVDLIAATRDVTFVGTRPVLVETLERTLRRSRTALSRDPAQLPGQLHARLKDEPEHVLAELGSSCGAVAGRPWLRMISGHLDWRSDLETTYGLSGKLRGLGFGQIGDRPVIAIAIDNRVVLWDPRQGAPEARIIDLGNKRATAVAVADIDGRSVVVTSAGYDLATDVWDARTGDHLASAPADLGHSVAVGLAGDRLVIAGVSSGGRPELLDARTLAAVEPAAALVHPYLRAFAVHRGALVALTVEPPRKASSAMTIAVLDAASGYERWRSVDIRTPYGEPDVIAGGDVGSAFLVIASCGNTVNWLTEGHAYLDLSTHRGKLRAAAVGSIDGRHVVASAPDYDSTALVELWQIAGSAGPDGVRLYRPRVAEVGDSQDPEFRFLRLPTELADRGWREGVETYSVQRPEDWPHTAAAEGELDGWPVLVTGSVEGAVWVWNTTETPMRPIAGPFTMVSPDTLDHGWTAVFTKPGVPTADSVAFGHHASLGPIVAVACNGAVRLYTVPAGNPVESPADAATVVDAVALGRVGDRDVLVTGSKGGLLGVWGLTPPERIAALTLDAPIVQIEVNPTGTIIVHVATKRPVVIELVEP